MKRRRSLLVFLSLLAAIPATANAQQWSGILDPTRAIDWSTAGVPGGIPSGSWTQSGATILAAAAPCNNGSGDCTGTIQTALNACGVNHFVLLGTGVFLINSRLIIPNNCALRGGG